MMERVFDTRDCVLGEGPLWHLERQQLFWFDIINKRLLSRTGDTPLDWQFDRHVSAAGWVDRDQLLIASETDLFLFNVETGTSESLCPLAADQAETRSNDGRADPWGGFWIGTMHKDATAHAGAIYRWFKGGLHLLTRGPTIANAICFSPDRKYAYYCDTLTRQIMRQPLEAEGWPIGEAEVFIDLNDQTHNPDGAVVDSEGCLWNAQWGASRATRYAPNGRELIHVAMPTLQTSCPAIRRVDLTTLYATSATQGLVDPSEVQGQTFAAQADIKGQAEQRVIL